LNGLMMAMTIFMGLIPLEARTEEDRLGGRNGARLRPHAGVAGGS
jgi:hypothetical protein